MIFLCPGCIITSLNIRWQYIPDPLNPYTKKLFIKSELWQIKVRLTEIK